MWEEKGKGRVMLDLSWLEMSLQHSLDTIQSVTEYLQSDKVKEEGHRSYKSLCTKNHIRRRRNPGIIGRIERKNMAKKNKGLRKGKGPYDIGQRNDREEELI